MIHWTEEDKKIFNTSENEEPVLIATGNTAEVYSTKDSKVVLKLFKSYMDYNAVMLEYKNAAYVTPLPFDKPKTYQLVRIDGRYGIVMDKIAASTLQEQALNYTCDELADILAQQHKKLLAVTLEDDELHNAKECYSWFINRSTKLTEQEKQEVYSLLDSLPDGNHLCHGDYHPGNVTADGTYFHIIDFMNIYKGAPESDIARTYYLIKLTPLSEDDPYFDFIKQAKASVTDQYIVHMEQAGYTEWKAWLPIILAARSGDGISEEEQEHAAKLYRKII